MWNYMCIRLLINWSDSTKKMHGATIRLISYSKIVLIFGNLRLFMMTTNLFVIANIK